MCEFHFKVIKLIGVDFGAKPLLVAHFPFWPFLEPCPLLTLIVCGCFVVILNVM
jgi:hypothetical protein